MSERNEHEHSIRFITTDYEELFRIPDDGTVLVTFPDRQFAEKCSYIDDYHMKVGNSVYHICQYAEILKQNGGHCAPEPETELAKAAWQLGHREYLMLERADTGFRYEILTKDFLSRTQGQLDRPEWTMNQAREYVLDLAGLDHRSRFAVSYDMVKQKSRDVLKSSDVRNIEWVDSKYYPGMRTAEHTLTCEIRGEPFRLAYEVSKHDDGEGFVIHSDGKDIWDLMPEPELEKLEFTLSRAVTFGHWKKDIDQAETVEAVRDVRYGIWETENLNLTREQIRELHEMIDRKEETLTAAMKKESVLKQLGETKPENGEKKAPKRQKKQKEGERT